jgi:hypothetical protein
MRRATWAVCGSTHAEQPRSNGFAVVANIVSHNWSWENCYFNLSRNDAIDCMQSGNKTPFLLILWLYSGKGYGREAMRIT